ncbi:MAG: glycosyltransferase [Bacteroidales bacterium]|nr:glycosyltransferase [Bacteroidales bacterium]
MLSICIAIHNWDVNQLVRDLQTQAAKLSVPYEILLLDDASEYDFQLKNACLDFEENVTYLQTYVNLGRSIARNTLAANAKYEYLLFIDCDAKVTKKDFLKKYLSVLPAQVVVGGCEYRKRRPKKDSVLRWAYGCAREEVPAEKRNLAPNRSFTPFNFLIQKKIFTKVKFDEKVQGYGHEDTLFGIELQKQHISIQHIDNALRHEGIGPTKQFLQQTQNGIDNLLALLERVDDREGFIQSITLLSTYHKLKSWHLVGFYRLFYSIFKKMIEKNLYSIKPSMRCFDFYKLGYLCEKVR